MLRNPLVYSRGAKEFNGISFDPLSVGSGKILNLKIQIKERNSNQTLSFGFGI
jgi:hypothetical protein